MVLDPISALNVAAAVVQFVDFSVRLFDKTREIRESSACQPVEARQIRGASAHLKEQCAILEQHERSISQVGSVQLSAGQNCLADVVKKSSEAAQQLLSTLDQLFKEHNQS